MTNEHPHWTDPAGALRELAPCESVPPGLRPLMLQAADEIERLQKDRNECLEAFHILFRIFPEPK